MWTLEGVSPYLAGPALAAALAALGLVVGILTGLFGVGGGFLVTPLLNLMLGIPYPIAIGSGLCTMIGSGASGLARHARLRNYEPRSILLMGSGAVAGAFVGAQVNVLLDAAFGTDGGRTYTLIMDGLYIVLLAGATAVLVWHSTFPHPRRSLLQRLRLPPRIDLAAAHLEGVSAPGIVLVGLGLGILSGLVGIGGGVFMMPVLVLVLGLTAHRAVGTSLGVVVLASVAGTIRYGLQGTVNLWVALAILVGTTIGIQIGAAICVRLEGWRLTRYFAALVILVAGWLVVDFVRKLVL